MIESIVQFWNDHSGSIIVSLIVSLLFFVLGPLGLWFSSKKIRRERIRKAKEQLLDILEGMIVNKGVSDEKKLTSLFGAVERDIDIDLSGDYSLESWLEDVILRFERSRHLSSEQKTEYYEEVKKLLDHIQRPRDQHPKKEISRQYEDIFDDITNAISSGESEKANNIIQELKKKISERPISQDPILNVFKIYRRIYQNNPFTFVTATFIVLVFYVFVLFLIP